jgi:hypothetical protein
MGFFGRKLDLYISKSQAYFSSLNQAIDAVRARSCMRCLAKAAEAWDRKQWLAGASSKNSILVTCSFSG